VASAVALGTVLDAGVVSTVPAGLIATVSTIAVGSATAVTTGLTLFSLKTMITSKLTLGLAATFVVVGATTAIITHHNTASIPPTVVAIPSVKTPTLPIAATPTVEAPKLAPVPAGGNPTLPADVESASASPDDRTAKKPVSVNVLGSVTSPGLITIPASQTPTLVGAIAHAHGPSSNAAATVTITRKMPDGSTTVFNDVDLYNATKGAVPDFPLQDGDTIMVGAQSSGASVWQ